MKRHTGRPDTLVDPVDELEVTPPKTYAAGLPAVRKAIEYSLSQTSVRRTALTLLAIHPPRPTFEGVLVRFERQ